MVRLTTVASLVAWMAMGCASRAPSHSSSAQEGQPPGFVSEEQKLMACLDLRDHIVELYADEYVSEQGLAMNRAERAAFRAGWAEELARKGTFEKFEQSCFYSLTPRKYRCGMASQTTDGLVACMKLTAR
ncbi:MAG TPA: hypothetical protein VF765_24915 [Polyangiaceae bacterium]